MMQLGVVHDFSTDVIRNTRTALEALYRNVLVSLAIQRNLNIAFRTRRQSDLLKTRMAF